MQQWQRAYLTACGGIIGFAIGYSLSVFGGWTKLTYFPYAARWAFVADAPLEVSSNYLGIFLWGVGGALFGAAVFGVAGRLSKKELSPVGLSVCGFWALTAHILAVAFFAWHLWPR